MASHEQLDRLAHDLEKGGADRLRVHAVTRARNFKRSWVEMAEVLVKVRNSRAYEGWGFSDFHDYCAVELQLKSGTVDKLTGSYYTIEQHAPEVLHRDGIGQKIPSIAAVDYFAKAVARAPEAANDDLDAKPEDEEEDLLSEIKHAVFDEGAPVTQLRQRFDSILNPKSDATLHFEAMKKILSASRRLTALLAESDEVSVGAKSGTLSALEGLERELEELLPEAREAARLAAQSDARAAS